MFRNLSIRSTLAVLLAVPVAATAALGVAGRLGDRAGADHERRVAAVAGRAAGAVHELQEERVRAAAWVAGEGRRGREELRARQRRTDRALAAYRAAAADLAPSGDPALDQAVAAAARRLDRLAVVRAEADRRLVTPPRTAADHDALVAALLGVLRGLAARLEAPEPARAARLLVAVAGAKEATGQERTLLASAATAARPDQGPATRATPANQGQPARAGVAGPGAAGRAATSDALAVRLAAAAAVARHELNGVRAAAGGRLDDVDRALDAREVRGVRRLELALLDPDPGAATPAGEPGTPGVGSGTPGVGSGTPGVGSGTPRVGSGSSGTRRPAAGAPPLGELEPWRAGLAVRSAALRRVERAVAADLAAAAGARLRRQETWLRGQLALAVLVLLAAAATTRLPGRPGGRRVPDEPAAVTGAALVGLARRGQVLVDRQLELLEELERREPDPDRRQDLRRLDHQATRLRRTADTLLAMAGPEPARRWDRPVPLADLLRAAVAGLEPEGPVGGAPAHRTRRIDLLTAGEAAMAGPAGADLVHLVSELLDNAAACSPPAAGITVTGAGDGDGYLIEVTDRGLGMTDQELAWANRRLAGAAALDPADLAAGGRLGLVIVGHLAGRNGLAVRLDRSPGGGVVAAVRLPAALLAPPAPVPARPG